MQDFVIQLAMPELPEVETVRRGLEDLLSYRPTLEKIELRRPDLRYKIPIKKLQELVGQPVLAVGRRAKYLWFQTPRGYIISHLGMTGSWRVKTEEGFDRHDHVLLHFSGSLSLVFRDPRRFGILDYSKDLKNDPFSRMGPEPFSDDFNSEYLKSQFKSRKGPIKNVLMDQSVVVGVGNIYASEILFECGIRPSRAAFKLTKSELEHLVEKTREVLARAIDSGGSTLRDFSHTDGESGSFQDEFKVYGREKKPCYSCGKIVKTKMMGGRSTFWCSNCQR